ncbi:MAG: NifU family protein [Luteibaculum sp.]
MSTVEEKKIPTLVYAEVTPNPNTVKFVANRAIMPFAGSVEFKTAAEAKGYSQMGLELFNMPVVQSLFFSTNFVSVSKVDGVEWDLITMQLREFIQDYLTKNEWAVEKLPASGEGVEKQDPSQPAAEIGHVKPQNELEEQIVMALDEYIRPAVETDGGAIDFRSFKEGTLEVTLRGSCSGCPSSVVTLKNGIETLMKNMVPEVKEVVAYEA